MQELCKNDHEVFNIDIRQSDYKNTIIHDIRKPIEIKSLKNLDLIFHLAAQTSSIISQEDPWLDINTNIYGALNITDLAMKNMCPIIFTSSMAVYNQANIDICSTPNPLSNYGISKYASEFIIKRLEMYQIKYKILRLFNIYGPGQDMNNLKQGMVSIFLQMALKNKKIIVKGSRDRTRDFVFIDDLINYLVTSMDNLDNRIINIGTGISTSVEELLNIINLTLKENGLDQASIEYTQGFTEDVFQISLDKELALKKTVSLYDGINRFIKEII